MRSRLCSLALLLLTITCLPAAAEDKPTDDVANPHTAEPQSTVIEGAGADTSSLPLEDLQMFADVFNQIRQGYVESVHDSELFELAVQGMLSGLDPHSVFLKEKAFDSLQETTQGEFSGLGIEIGQDRGYITIIAPIDGSPAEAAGLKAGDVILKIDGESIRDVPVSYTHLTLPTKA